ncbi:hypothetical protein K227x_62220 [Rubripirellula lacrimiformis]|uniref:Uncharacterized protein n=1 Tax=Rubripirellula lacrimiformis TaxID=1930273 RepID=A0A517NKX7_9BACT|nr:hypothetical protein [Rubripirellula lacrimiformis]QDT07794.1 hypothetical protein K227x_62220 [Rubripirellula lacrimiformis]
MKTFKDNQGHEWNLALSLASVRKHRQTLGLDLFNHEHHRQVMESLVDRLAFCFLLVEEQAKAIEVSVDQFEERLYGDGFSTEAGVAFLEELADFYQKLGQKAFAMLTTIAIKAIRAGETRMQDLESSGQITSLISQAEDEVERMFQESAGNGSPS